MSVISINISFLIIPKFEIVLLCILKHLKQEFEKGIKQKLTPRILAEPILVGRKKELEELKRCLGSSLSGKGVAVFISGEAGAGKTRLTTEFLNIAKKKQVTVLAGWCLSDVTVPYFPFIEAFDSYISSNEDDGVSIAKPANKFEVVAYWKSI